MHASPLPDVIPVPTTGSPLDTAELVAAGFLAAYPPLTRTKYTLVLRQWFTWCRANGLPVLQAKRQHVDLWARTLLEIEHQKESTVAGKLGTVSGFYKAAVMDGVLDANPAAYARRPRVDTESHSTWLNRTQLSDFLTAAKATSPRDYALCCLYAYNGLRASEAVGIDVEHLSRRDAFPTVTVRRKGGRSQTLPLNYWTSHAVELLLDTLEPSRGPLFRAIRSGRRITRTDAYWIVRKVAETAGLNRNGWIHPHSLRHSFATLSLDAGVSLRDVQHSGGWKSPKMPDYYDRRRESLARNSTHPLGIHVEGAT